MVVKMRVVLQPYRHFSLAQHCYARYPRYRKPSHFGELHQCLNTTLISRRVSDGT